MTAGAVETADKPDGNDALLAKKKRKNSASSIGRKTNRPMGLMWSTGLGLEFGSLETETTRRKEARQIEEWKIKKSKMPGCQESRRSGRRM